MTKFLLIYLAVGIVFAILNAKKQRQIGWSFVVVTLLWVFSIRALLTREEEKE